MSKRSGRAMCSVVGCNNRYCNTEPSVKFYSFPSRPHEMDLRRKWILAVNRKKKDGTLWMPSKSSRICSKHFVGGCKSQHPASPAYVPSIFPECYRRESTGIGSLNRFTRLIKRSAMEVALVSDMKTEPPMEENPSDVSSSEEPCRSMAPLHYEPEEVFVVMPKTEPDYPETEGSIKEEFPQYHDIKQEICIEEINIDWEEPDIIRPGGNQFICLCLEAALPREWRPCLCESQSTLTRCVSFSKGPSSGLRVKSSTESTVEKMDFGMVEIAEEAAQYSGNSVFEEILGLADNRRNDIIAFKNKNRGYIMDPTVRFGSHKLHRADVNLEKRNINLPTIPCYRDKYMLEEIDIVDLMIGARGTVLIFCNQFLETDVSARDSIRRNCHHCLKRFINNSKKSLLQLGHSLNFSSILCCNMHIS